jgi:hypothetical protein
MPPSVIYIIRHCDKTDDPNDCFCSAQGHIRSYLLPHFWYRELPLGSVPNSLVATNFQPDDSKCENCSQREVLVLTPTAQLYNKTIHRPFCSDQTTKAAEFIMQQTGIVIVAWEHKKIPELAHKLGAPQVGKWPADRYDIVFRLVMRPNRTCFRFSIFTEMLGLTGDSVVLPPDYQPFRNFYFLYQF